MKYYKNKNGELLLGNCLDVMKDMKENSIDLIVTDPPYQLSSTTKHRIDNIAVNGSDGKGNPFCRQQAQKGFMGKEWDVLPSVNIWKECLRVLKPGAFAFIMSSPRQDCLCEMISRIGKAGFITGFTSIYWAFASGFPKAGNVSKLVGKKLGAERKTTVLNENYRPISGKKGYQREQIFKQTDGMELRHDTPATPEAKALEGSYLGFQPKPAVEIILVVMKPLECKGYTEQAMKNGKGCTWLDNCRIPYKSEGDKWNRSEGFTPAHEGYGKGMFTNKNKGNSNIQGRFPANLLVSDDVLADGKVSKSSDAIRHNIKTNHKFYNETDGNDGVDSYGFNGRGSFSRYFSLDSWWAERIKQLPKSVQKTFPFLIVPKASKGEKNKGCEELENGYGASINMKCANCGGNTVGTGNPCKCNNRQPVKVSDYIKNIHPTAKPLQLMSYLIILGSRPGDTILDPFAGSGTTCIAAGLLDRRFIGIEKEAEYIEIAKHRLQAEDPGHLPKKGLFK